VCLPDGYERIDSASSDNSTDAKWDWLQPQTKRISPFADPILWGKRNWKRKSHATHAPSDTAIYGVFGWCPDCGVHNSLQILNKNLELARKELALAASADPDVATYLIGDALENAVVCAHAPTSPS
jgi:hypothetical protein